VLTEKNIENATVILLFCHTSENTVLTIAVTVESHTSHNDECVKISQKIFESL